jgi:type I restriction enzyme S subunit
MNMLPNGWAEAMLSAICEKVTDGTHHSPVNLPAGPFRYVTAKNIRPDGLDLTHITYVDAETHRAIFARCPVESGDVLYIKDGATTGLAILNRLEEPFSLLSSVALLKPRRSVLDGSYLKHWLNAPSTLESMLRQMTGTAIRRLTLGIISSQRVPLAPFAEQRRIVAKIDSLSSKSKRAREHLDHIPRLVEKYKQAVLSLASNGQLTERWRQECGLGAWSKANVEHVAQVLFDGPFGSHLKSSDYVTEGVRVVRLENIGHLHFNDEKRTYVSLEKYKSLKKHTLQADDVLFSSFVDEEVRVCLFPHRANEPAINKADCFCIRVDSTVCDPDWLSYRLACRSTYEQLREEVHGATRPRINLTTLKSLILDVPEINEQREIVRRIRNAFTWIDRLGAEATSARTLIDRLDHAVLAKAFRGELVPQDPKDEPASVLLERIRAEREAGPQAKPRRGRTAKES